MSKVLVSIVMGSDSDLEIMREAGKALDEFGIAYEIDVTSAHRSPSARRTSRARPRARHSGDHRRSGWGSPFGGSDRGAYDPAGDWSGRSLRLRCRGWILCWLRCRCRLVFRWLRLRLGSREQPTQDSGGPDDWIERCFDREEAGSAQREVARGVEEKSRKLKSSRD